MIGEYLKRFRIWYTTYSTEITWFLIGLLVSDGLGSLARGNYNSAALSLGLAYLNYFMNKR